MLSRAARAVSRNYSPLNTGDEIRPEKRDERPDLRIIDGTIHFGPEQQAQARGGVMQAGIGHNSGLREPLMRPNRSLGLVISQEGGGTTYRLPSGGVRFLAFNAG